MKLLAISSFEKYLDNAAPEAVLSRDKIEVIAARNGYECGQLLVFAENELHFDVEVSDLIEQDGAVYSAANVTVYAEKYIYIDRNWQTNGLPTGSYPDALLPLQAAKDHGETQVDAGKNRGIWLEFFVPEDQKPGIYRGGVTVKAEQTQQIPVELEVLALTIPEFTGVRTLFHTNYEHMCHYETGDMRQMHDKYVQYLLKHRICQTDFARTGTTDAGIVAYAEKAAQLYDQGFRTFSFPSVDEKVDGYTSFSGEHVEKYLFALAQKSIEKGVDLVKCVAFYDWQIDEPFYCNYQPGRVESSVERFAAAAQRTAEKCTAMPGYDSSLGRRVIQSVKNAVHVITDYYVQPYRENKVKLDRNGNVYHYDRPKVTLCPKYDGYDTPELAKDYEDCQERWWYGCNSPGAPFVSFHLDDAVFSPRIVGGMMARRGIVGNLYWANNIYTEFNTTGSPVFLDDPYQTAHRGSGANGEGAILYPGSIYGVDGPVGCIRLKQIREGHQDWDILQQVQARYEQAGSSFWNIYDREMCYLSHGVKIDSIDGDYGLIHTAVLHLAEAALSPAGLLVDCTPEEAGVRFTVRASRDCRVCVDGEELEIGEATFYRPYLACGWFTLVYTAAGKTHSIPIYQGRGMEIILHEILYKQQAVTAENGTVSLNSDDVRREITVALEENNHIRIQLPEPVLSGQTLGFEVKTVAPCFCTVYAEGYEQEKRRFRTIPRWNRIQIPTDTETFQTRAIHIELEMTGRIGLGAVYIRR